MTIISGLKVTLADLCISDNTHPMTKDDAPISIKKKSKGEKKSTHTQKSIISTNMNLKRKPALGPCKLHAQPLTLNTSMTTACGPQHI